jgi:hypothetical protein
MGIIDEAIDLGLPCFPCRGNKAPACPRGFKDAVEGADAIRELWRQWPGSLVGVPTGAASGFDVLDIDPRNGGGEWYGANKQRLPATRIHRTRSGGLHLLFYADGGVKNSSGLIAPGVDVRAGGGYVVWWPAAGLPCRDYPPEGLPDWPTWLRRAIVPPPPPRVVARTMPRSLNGVPGIIRVVLESHEGERNRALYWAACRHAEMARAGLISPELAAELLIEAGQQRGLTLNETVATVRSAFGGRHG